MVKTQVSKRWGEIMRHRIAGEGTTIKRNAILMLRRCITAFICITGYLHGNLPERHQNDKTLLESSIDGNDKNIYKQREWQ
jgi:hypothetical protein